MFFRKRKPVKAPQAYTPVRSSVSNAAGAQRGTAGNPYDSAPMTPIYYGTNTDYTPAPSHTSHDHGSCSSSHDSGSSSYDSGSSSGGDCGGGGGGD